MKVNIKVQINSIDNCTKFNTKGILNEKTNILTYSEENNTKVKFDLHNNKLIRENDEFIMKLHFLLGQTSKLNLYMKDLNQETVLEVKTLLIDKKESFCKVVYLVEGTTKNEYIIEVEK